jgi:glycosyltransferase involved in cell wall biosynthesis
MLGSVRYRQAQECSTDFIAFVDSDVYLRDCWWEVMSKELRYGVGWVLGALYVPFPKGYSDYFYWTTKAVGTAAFSNTIVHRQSMLECTELKKIHLFEDFFVLQHIKKKGLKAAFVTDFVADHEPVSLRGMLNRSVRAGQSLRIKEGFSRALVLGILASVSDAKLVFRFFWDTGKLSLRLPFIILIFRLAIIYGIMRRNLVRKV